MVRKVDGTVHSAFIRAYGHQVILVDLKIRGGSQKGLDELIGGHYIFKAAYRDGVLNAGVMGVKGNDVRDPVLDQLLQCESAVQRLAAVALMLAGLIKEGHDHVDTCSLSGRSGNETLKILVMIIRRHGYHASSQIILDAVVADVNEEVKIRTADRFLKSTLSFA